MLGSTDECRRAAALADNVMANNKQHPTPVGHRGQKKVISEKGEKQTIRTKYLLNADQGNNKLLYIYTEFYFNSRSLKTRLGFYNTLFE